MGASDFRTVATGKDVADAYRNAVESATYEHGHDPYNGTISTTHGYAVVPAVKGLTYDQQIDLIWKVEAYGVPERPAIRRSFTSEWDRREHKENRKTYQRWERMTPIERQAIQRAAASIEKWGPALCIEVTGKAAVDLKKARGRAGTRDRVFAFFGLAAM